MGRAFNSKIRVGERQKNDRPGDNQGSKFENPENIREYLDHLSSEQEEYLAILSNKIDNQNGLGFLNLMNINYREIKDICPPYSSDQFKDIVEFLLNRVPEEAGKVGVICYNGKNAEGKNCIFIKLRRAIDYDAFDLRLVEGPIKSSFGSYYMGGGGHPSAVSFRVFPCTKDQFISKFEPVIGIIKGNMQ